MPLNILRLNAPHPQPSSQITFIKPLPGPSSAHAQDFLERIAAICHPIMKSHHLSITTLEEYEPNREFVGRNFNAGEIIQLVLRSQRNGAWLSFRTVQMVMMHELAHCVQMNHSRQFWGVRNKYAEELRGLWRRGYTGDGLWGRGRTLLSGEYDRGGRGEGDVLPEHLCGGAYRRRRAGGRKRKKGPGEKKEEETYAEKNQRRIAKKFGVSGQALGGDEETRVKLEYGQVVKGKPRVAQSARGRELRVAAALARFGQQNNEDDKAVSSPASVGDQKEDDLFSGEEEDDASTGEAEGSMIKVCGSEDGDDVDVKHEMDELRDLDSCLPESYDRAAADDAETTDDEDDRIKDERPQEYTNDSQPPNNHLKSAEAGTTDDENEQGPTPSQIPSKETPLPQNHQVASHPTRPALKEDPSRPLNNINCPICSMENPQDSPLCQACSHVLKPDLIPNHWRCQSAECKDSSYLNNGDSGLCGVCGGRKPTGGVE